MIVFNVDVMLARRKMSLTELSERVGITMANLSILKTGKAKAVRVETLNKLCHALDCHHFKMRGVDIKFGAAAGERALKIAFGGFPDF